MDLRQLETFLEVCKYKSFSKAADKLFITQPTVTSHIQNLEKELGTVLINRTGKNMSLTQTGNILFKYALDIINTCEMAKFDLSSYRGKINGHLDISSSSVPRQYLLPKILKEFISIYPDVTFSLKDKDSKQVIKSILSWETDFGIVGAMYPSNNLEYIELMEDRLLLVTANNENFPYNNFETLELDILFKENLIFREKGSGTRELLEKTLKSNNISSSSLKILAYIEDTETIKNLISLGAGVSFLSERTVQDKYSLERFKVFNVKNLDLSRKFYFVYHKNRQLSPLSETFKDFVLEYTKVKNQAK
ncbi:selenium metabolism-associated LysR family transcriptional regulator [Anaerosalibacter sp. Marseille-P3206]|uniref:selenium metabolism-associated LysR family transcriptional regulator n=1 Tax=Anaerosalibacter sp. Marseille-P3206 TaxID=1871005 RepID=UPI000986474E|nr:selenium metabolism-associated LysR family transcriptional regulator [Anaerosalibacter sp. Marseille-P3206]